MLSIYYIIICTVANLSISFDFVKAKMFSNQNSRMYENKVTDSQPTCTFDYFIPLLQSIFNNDYLFSVRTYTQRNLVGHTNQDVDSSVLCI
jgi:hypothetical protein